MPSIHLNPSAATWAYTPSTPLTKSHPVLGFHRSLPFYTQTPLHPLPALASSLKLGHVLVKDESTRFGLPAFKILGASWAIYRVVLERLEIDISAVTDPKDLPDAALLGGMLRERGLGGLKVVTCTMGNWGRAMAKMGSHMGVHVVVYVPSVLVEETRDLIRGEGAEVGMWFDIHCVVSSLLFWYSIFAFSSAGNVWLLLRSLMHPFSASFHLCSPFFC